MKIISWNVNGIRSVIKKDLWYSFVNEHDPDILCLQEVRAEKKQFSFNDQFNSKYQYQFFNTHHTKKGYSGTAIITKTQPLNVIYPEFDKEGRIIIAEYPLFFIVCVYVPNSGTRFDYRVKEWDILFRNYIKELSKPIIVGGDFNIAKDPIDIYNPKIKNVAGVTPEEKENFKVLLELFVDSFRLKNPKTIKYSWWSNMYNARSKNNGWRIDYFLTSPQIVFSEADILENVIGSDHAPILLTL